MKFRVLGLVIVHAGKLIRLIAALFPSQHVFKLCQVVVDIGYV